MAGQRSSFGAEASSSGASTRQLRVAEMLKRTLSQLLQRQDIFDDDLKGQFIIISEVRMSADLKLAKVYVTKLGGGDVALQIKALARNHHFLRTRINKALHLKFSPQLRFMADESFDEFEKMRGLLAQKSVQDDLAKP